MIAAVRLGRRVLTLVVGLMVAGIPLQAQHTIAEQYLFDAVNTARISAGLPPLTWSDGLNRAAADHAERMRKEDALSHQFDEEADLPERVAATGVRFSIVSENVGVSDSAIELYTAWMGSQDHRENILDPKVTAIGIAIRERAGELWAVQDFAKATIELSLEEQERQVGTLLRASGLKTVAATASARQTCRDTSSPAANRPVFVLRFTVSDLTQLPAQLAARLALGTVSEAAVGACETARKKFGGYSIAVVLYR